MKKSIVYASFTLALLLMLSSCTSVKPGATKSGKNLYETFFVGEQGTQYFIKPLVFDGIERADQLKLDFIFRYKTTLNSAATLTYTLQNNAIFKKIDSIRFNNNTFHAVSSDNTLLFNERVNKGYASRHTGTLPLKDLTNLFQNPEWDVIVYAHQKTYTYKANSKTKKAIQKLHQHVFVLIE